jgi:hypothetical protein
LAKPIGDRQSLARQAATAAIWRTERNRIGSPSVVSGIRREPQVAVGSNRVNWRSAT